MHTVHLQFVSAEDAKWVREICQKQLENPGERVDKLHMGILIDSIRKARSVSITLLSKNRRKILKLSQATRTEAA